MADERQLRVTIDKHNMTPLSVSGYQLQVAKSVISNGGKISRAGQLIKLTADSAFL
jgi:hypothetical protein